MRTLYLFDVDDTLVYSHSGVHVKKEDMEIDDSVATEWSQRQDIFHFSTREFKDIKNGENPAFKCHENVDADFSDFRDPSKVWSAIVNGDPGPGIGVLNEVLGKWKKELDVIGILTMRADVATITSAVNFFLECEDSLAEDFAFEEKNVVCLDDLKEHMHSLGLSKNEWKRYIIVEKLKEFDRVVFIDDDEAYFEYMKDLKNVECIKV
jgi:hypothetical protein